MRECSYGSASRAANRTATARFPAEEEPLLRLLLIVIVIAIGADAIINNGAYTQAAWRELTSYTVRFQNPSGSDPKLEIEKKP
jgi:hypothetical protein